MKKKGRAYKDYWNAEQYYIPSSNSLKKADALAKIFLKVCLFSGQQ